MLILPKRVLTNKNGAIDLSARTAGGQAQPAGAEELTASATGSWGDVTFRQMAADGIQMEFHRLRFTSAAIAAYSSPHAGLRLQICLASSLSYRIDGFDECVLHDRGLSLYYAPAVEFSMQMAPEEIHRTLILHFLPGHLQPLTESLPKLGPFLEKVHLRQPAVFQPAYCMANGELTGLAEKLDHCPYTGKARAAWQNSIAREILVLALVRMSDAPDDAAPVNESDARIVYAAKELLLKEIEKTFSLSSLAQRMGMSTYKLNNGFRAIYGMGVTEWLLEARMTRAHKLLEGTDDTVSQVAYQSGYSHPHSFTLAFKKYFGYTPAFVQKSGRKV
ncbi:MAG: AraC family transcriptional regulator [Bacteroidota bacterium]|nr:AraC family transcriptional regulator [Bacteroidota bacterium]MDP4214840.1 AraC family transcriptional regulator [Bacteroidota bacterium]MDP4247729.1 AraC family transcriptional regulator [Bacteroidota bacterium]MDP4256233.1 AraC family transcriptional regulator [Bacteroidota bacterium]MDP4259038.1 AraC family transcriptional regulator [Bacteroidota bacterium]